MPIRIIRVHQRPPRQEALLREIAAKLQRFNYEPQLFGETERCYGCGKFGIFLCQHCNELLRAVDKKKLEQSQKLMSTVEQRFAAQHFE